MSDENSAKMLRMVRYKGLLQDADRLRDPTSQDPYQALARIIHMGDAIHARAALLEWLEHEVTELEKDPFVTVRRIDALKATYLEMAAKIDGRQTVMATELGYYSQNVAPDYGAKHYEFNDWATASFLRKMFDEGKETIVHGHVGTGKTHLAVLLMERLLGVVERSVIITNIAGVKDKSGQFTSRIYHVSLLSEILRIWSQLPPDTPIILLLDEPESNLRGGSSKSVKVFNDFRYMLRKLGIAKLEIWHSESEIYKALREEASESIYRIFKDDKTSFQLDHQVRGADVHRRIENVPGLEFLEFATRGLGSIDIDVNLQAMLRGLAKLYRMEDMKASVDAALKDPGNYLDAYRENGPETLAREAVLVKILADRPRYSTERGAFNVARIREDFALSWREATALAREARRRRSAPMDDGPSAG